MANDVAHTDEMESGAEFVLSSQPIVPEQRASDPNARRDYENLGELPRSYGGAFNGGHHATGRCRRERPGRCGYDSDAPELSADRRYFPWLEVRRRRARGNCRPLAASRRQFGRDAAGKRARTFACARVRSSQIASIAARAIAQRAGRFRRTRTRRIDPWPGRVEPDVICSRRPVGDATRVGESRFLSRFAQRSGYRRLFVETDPFRHLGRRRIDPAMALAVGEIEDEPDQQPAD